MAIKFSNDASTKLLSPMATASTSFTVTLGDGDLKFPSITGEDYFPCTLVKSDGSFEIVKVTARVGDTFTCERAQEGTTAKTFEISDRVELRLTAASLEQLLNQEYASTAEVITGTETQKAVTPESFQGGFDARKADQASIEAGTDDAKYITPKSAKDAGIVLSDTPNNWAAAQQYSVTQLTSSGGNLAWDISTAPEAKITLSENTTVQAATGQAEGRWAVLRITGNGSFTTTWDSSYIVGKNLTLPVAINDGKTVTLLFRSAGATMELMGSREEV